MHVVIAVSRSVSDVALIYQAVNESGFTVSLVISGGERGEDTLGEQFAVEQGVPFVRMNADWGAHGRKADMRCNEDLLRTCDAVVVIWDGEMAESAKHMMDITQSAGKPCHVLTLAPQREADNTKGVYQHDGTGQVLVMTADEAWNGGGETIDPVDPCTLPAGTVIEGVAMGVSTVLPSMDFETYSAVGYELRDGKIKGIGPGGKGGLPVVGTPAYAEHPSTEIICLYYDLKDGKGRRGWFPGTPNPVDLLDLVAGGGMAEAFNSTFEWYIWNCICVHRYGWPSLRIEQTVCVMSRARRHSLPGSLAKLAPALGTADKDKAGKALITKLCRPHTPTKKRKEIRRTTASDWPDFVAMYQYCDRDVETEDKAAALIPDLTPEERETWLVDQRINARGVHVDVDSLDACLFILQEATRVFTEELNVITGGAVSGVGEVAKMKVFLKGQNCYAPDMTADTVTSLLKRDDLTDDARRVLEIRQALGGANVKKLAKLKLQVSSDGRLRNQYMYCGADRTGRWSSSAADDGASNSQLQNITAKGPESQECDDCGHITGHKSKAVVMGIAGACPQCGSLNWKQHKIPGTTDTTTKRPDWTVEAVECALEAIRTRDIKYVMDVWGDPCAVLAGCLRGLFNAAPGKKLICADFSAVEAVVLACLSRCQWRIDVFNTHGKIYEMSASKITGTPFEEFAAYKKENGMNHPLRKKIGKVAELACFTHDTQVLTSRGYVRIVEVKSTDKLWDGVTWVTSDGAIHKGKREVINLDGVSLTRDHPVSLGSSWKEARLLASSKNTLSQALAHASASLPSCVTKNGTSEGALSALALAVRSASSTCLTYMAGSLRAAGSVGARKAETHTLSCTPSTRTFCQTRSTDADSLTGCGPRSQGATHPKIKDTGTTEQEGYPCVMGGEAKTGRAHSCRTSSHSAGGMTLPSRWTGSKRMEIMNQGTSDSSRRARTGETSARSPSCKKESTTCKKGSTNSRDVYDIVNAGPRHRFTIKTDTGHLIVHNSGYGGWVGAWTAFGADKFMTEDEMKQNILKWRDESPEIVEFWGGQFRQTGPRLSDGHPELFGLEGMAIAAVLEPGKCFPYIDVAFAVRDDILYCRLPSGRFLHYHQPRLSKVPGKWGKPDSYSLTFMGYNSNSQKGPIGWCHMETYGGRLAENITQAVSADIQADALKGCEAEQYHVVMHTHDEACSEVPQDFGNVDEMCAIMARRPAWASWWPLRAAGWTHQRYQKD